MTRLGACRWGMASVVAAVFVATIVGPARAQQGRIEMHLDARVIEPNEVIRGRLVCTNTGEPQGTPRVHVQAGVALRLLGSTPSKIQSLRSINGRTTREVRYTYHFSLSVAVPGEYVIGPFEIDAGGKTYSAEAQTIRVTSVSATAVPRGDSFIFTEIDVTPRSLYVTQSYTATLTIGIRRVMGDRGHVEMNLLSSVLDQRASQFAIFGGGEMTKTLRTLTDSQGRRNVFEVFEVRKTIRADDPGTVTIGPVFLKADYPTKLRRGFGFFSAYEVVSARKETARADAVSVEVKAPPARGRPADFKGAIGRYHMTVKAKPTRLTQGSPITLTMTLRGNPLAGVAGPELSSHAELASRFDFTKDELVGDIERGAKVFRRAIFPKHEGPQTIPSIRWSFFDPKSEQYVTRVSDPIDIVVDAPSLEGRRIVLDDDAGAGGRESSLTAIAGGVAPNHTGIDALLADQRFVMGPGWTAAASLGPLVYLLSSLLVRRRSRLRDDPDHARRRGARRKADAGFAQAGKITDAGDRLHAIAETFKDYVADRFLLAEGHLTAAELRAELDRRGVGESLAGEIESFLVTCEAVRYAPGGSDLIDPIEAVKRIRSWMKSIDAAAKHEPPPRTDRPNA